MLSDNQERAWYDSHRDNILHGSPEVSGDHYEHNMRVTTPHDILGVFRKLNGQTKYEDSPEGFFGILNKTFASLAYEEEMACQWAGINTAWYPPFGAADDNYQKTVRSFYAVWASFVTQKPFLWKDVYRYAEAPDRRIRRLMEKENRRLREEGIREYNDAVKSLVAFVRKRDPRVPSSQENDIDRQKILRDATTAQASRSRLANQQKINQSDALPEWVRLSEPAEHEISDYDEVNAPREEVECVLCSKSFKSEKQFEAHERSKKHLKAVQQVQRQMHHEAVDLDINTSTPQNLSFPEHNPSDESIYLPHYQSNGLPEAQGPSVGLSEPIDQAAVVGVEEASNTISGVGDFTHSTQSETSGDDDMKSQPIRVETNAEGASYEGSSPQGHTLRHLTTRSSNDSSGPRIGKAKAKRARKVAKEGDGMGEPYHKCAACEASFPSRTRLFQHINDFGHAQKVQHNKASKGRRR